VSAAAAARAPGPVSAGALVLALMTAAGALLVARGDGWSSPRTRAPRADGGDEVPDSPGSLSREDALTEFRRLYALWLRAYRARDATLVPLFVAPDASRAMTRIDDEIVRMRRDGVIDRSRLSRRRVTVARLGRDEVRVRESSVETARFLDERSGEDLTRRPRPRLLEVMWTMRRYDDGWRLAESLVVAARPWRQP
jgi:hypothetical protein